jgi:hypothetical protein
MKEKCYANNGELKVELDSSGCRAYACSTETQICNSIKKQTKRQKIPCIPIIWNYSDLNQIERK